MVYIHSWQEYQDAAEALYAKSPNKTRYCVKWKSSEGKLVLKITDNTTCIKFKTYSNPAATICASTRFTDGAGPSQSRTRHPVLHHAIVVRCSSRGREKEEAEEKEMIKGEERRELQRNVCLRWVYGAILLLRRRDYPAATAIVYRLLRSRTANSVVPISYPLIPPMEYDMGDHSLALQQAKPFLLYLSAVSWPISVSLNRLDPSDMP
ncbi:putative signal recognition particle 9 kDa protein (SRP9) [Lyophyllum shimeji]|uniref:Signal recognition particle 9 kDa protein (SRP9) n=1 Tax=Lyophyllum shimeji TaxID=47721 RepID=A0A9P3PWI6_LYOSH|nr:putative signal recognition particle 9 kDa protein (SRP9) [Lyophyllum shimeji]